MPAIENTVSFHVVTEGTCLLELADHEPITLRAGDLALVPHGRGHQLIGVTERASEPGPTSEPTMSFRVDLLPQEYLGPQHSRLSHGGGGAPARLICGIVGFEAPAACELARRLPALITVPRDTVAAHSRILDSVRMMGEELAAPSLGGDVIASRLADIIVIQTLRMWLQTDPAARTGWFLALTDPRIGKALQAIEADPGAPWDVTSLARAAAMSRSSFSERFATMVGETPIAYLTRWRMDVARSLLSDTPDTTAEIARQVGYQSEAAFSRAFSRHVGCTPSAWRQTSR